MALGLALRLYRFSEQSFWMDEILAIRHLKAPDVLTHLLLLEIEVPEQAQGPVFYILQYYWAHLVGLSDEALRSLPLILGMAAMPLVYGFGRYLFNRRVGLVAALCVALSPQHIWHAQEVRPYALLTPLAIISAYALLRALRGGGRKWWALNVAVNVLLPWVHMFAVFISVVEGCFLLFYFRRVWRQAIIWGIAHTLLMAPWLVWIYTMPYVNDNSSLMLTAQEVVGEIFADDVINLHCDLRAPWKTNPPELLTPTLRSLLKVRPGFDVLLIAIFGLCSAWLSFYAVRAQWRYYRAGSEAPPPISEPAENGMMLLLFLVLPGFILGTLELVTKLLFFGPMYSMYNTVALYIATGVLITRLPRRSLRMAAIGLLIALFGYQLAIFLPYPTRTDWRAGADYIKANASPQDTVFDLEFVWYDRALDYYLDGSGLPVHVKTTFQAACDDSAAILAEAAAGTPDGGPEPSVWWAFYTWLPSLLWPGFTLDHLPEDLADRGLTATCVPFPGHFDLVVYRVQRAGDEIPRATETPVRTVLMTLDYEDILTQWVARPPDRDDREEAIRVMRRVVGNYPHRTQAFYFQSCMDLLEAGRPDLAAAAARHILKSYPDFGLAYFALASALAAQQDTSGAREAFETAFTLHRGLRRLLGPLASRLCEGDEPEAARAEVEKLDSAGFIYAPALYEACRERFQ